MINNQVCNDQHLLRQLRYDQPRHQNNRQVKVTEGYSIFILSFSILSDCIIFLFLGMSIFTHTHKLHWEFVLATIILCTIVRCKQWAMAMYNVQASQWQCKVCKHGNVN